MLITLPGLRTRRIFGIEATNYPYNRYRWITPSRGPSPHTRDLQWRAAQLGCQCSREKNGVALRAIVHRGFDSVRGFDLQTCEIPSARIRGMEELPRL